MGDKMNYYKRWREGMKQITPLQQTRAKATGHFYGAIGLSIAWVGLLYRTITDFNLTSLGFTIFVFFLVWLQRTEYIGTKQRLVIMERAELEDKEMEILKDL